MVEATGVAIIALLSSSPPIPLPARSSVRKPARERLTLIRIFEELRALGYEGSYDAVRPYARVWRQAHGTSKCIQVREADD